MRDVQKCRKVFLCDEEEIVDTKKKNGRGSIPFLLKGGSQNSLMITCYAYTHSLIN